MEIETLIVYTIIITFITCMLIVSIKGSVEISRVVCSSTHFGISNDDYCKSQVERCGCYCEGYNYSRCDI